MSNRILPGLGKKLYPKFVGPYRVIKNLGRQRYKIKDLVTGVHRDVHADQVKITPEGEVPRAVNSRVRFPHAHLPPPGEIETTSDPTEEVQSDFLVWTLHPFPSSDSTLGTRESGPDNNADRTSGGTGNPTPSQPTNSIVPTTEITHPTTNPTTTTTSRYNLRQRNRKSRSYCAHLYVIHGTASTIPVTYSPYLT